MYVRTKIMKCNQHRFAEILGYKNATIVSLIENGHKSPYQKLQKISQVSGMKISWFLEDGHEKNAKEWKSQQYDYLRRMFEDVFGITLKKPYTEMSEEEFYHQFDGELHRFGITHPEIKEFIKSIPAMDQEKCLKMIRKMKK